MASESRRPCILFRRVAERQSGRDSTPAPDEGFVAEVEFDDRHETALPGCGKECQVCRTPGDVPTEHLKAHIRVHLDGTVSLDFRHETIKLSVLEYI